MGAGDTITEYTYNNVGLLNEETIDYDADGTINESTTHTYNSLNQLTEQFMSQGWLQNTIISIILMDILLETQDDLSDGYIDTQRTYSYDSLGNRLSNVYILNYNGQIMSAYYWTFNSASQMTSEKHYEEDYNGNFEQLYLKEWVYTNGLLDQYEYTNFYNGYADSNGNYSEYFYNSTSQLTAMQNGTWDWCCSLNPVYTPASEVSYQYDSDGNLVLESVDSNLSGNVTQTTSYTYNPQFVTKDS